MGDDDAKAPPRGVALAVLLRMRDEAQALAASEGPARSWRTWEQPPSRRAAGEPLTTEDVCFELVKPATQALRCAYIDLLAPGEVGPASTFISHAWRYAFADVVGAVEAEHEPDATGRTTHYWFDLCLNSQHGTAERPFSWWTTTFRQSIARIGRTLLVLSPWDDPVPLARSWCLFEIWSTADTGSRLVVQMPPAHEAAFVEAIQTRLESIALALSRLSLERATAFSPADQAAIRRAVDASVGVPALDALVLQLMRNWLADAGRRAVAAAPENLRLKSWLGVLLDQMGQFADAERLYRDALAGFELELGADHQESLSAVANLGVGLFRMGRWEEAEPWLRSALEGFERTRGPEHEDTISAYCNLGALLASSGRTAEAEPFYTTALQRAETALGPDSAVTLRALGNTAALLHDRGRVHEALPLMRRVADARLRALGPGHPQTLNTLHNLVAVLHRTGANAEAEPHSLTLVNGRAKSLGAEDAETLASLALRRDVLAELGRADEAEAVARTTLAGCEATHGVLHERTLRAAAALAKLLRAAVSHAAVAAAGGGASPRAREAEALLRRVAEGWCALAGETDNAALSAQSELCAHLRARAQFAAAEAEMSALAERAARALGAEAPMVTTIRFVLANEVLRALGAERHADAEAMLREVLEARARTLGAHHPHTQLAARALGTLLAEAATPTGVAEAARPRGEAEAARGAEAEHDEDDGGAAAEVLAEAIQLLSGFLDDSSAQLPDDAHELRRSTLLLLGRAQWRQGHTQPAAASLERAARAYERAAGIDAEDWSAPAEFDPLGRVAFAQWARALAALGASKAEVERARERAARYGERADAHAAQVLAAEAETARERAAARTPRAPAAAEAAVAAPDHAPSGHGVGGTGSWQPPGPGARAAAVTSAVPPAGPAAAGSAPAAAVPSDERDGPLERPSSAGRRGEGGGCGGSPCAVS